VNNGTVVGILCLIYVYVYVHNCSWLAVSTGIGHTVS